MRFATEFLPLLNTDTCDARQSVGLTNEEMVSMAEPEACASFDET